MGDHNTKKGSNPSIEIPDATTAEEIMEDLEPADCPSSLEAIESNSTRFVMKFQSRTKTKFLNSHSVT